MTSLHLICVMLDLSKTKWIQTPDPLINKVVRPLRLTYQCWLGQKLP